MIIYLLDGVICETILDLANIVHNPFTVHLSSNKEIVVLGLTFFCRGDFEKVL